MALTDGLGTTRGLTDASGALSDEYFYEAFGELLASTGSTDNDYLYTGEQYDRDLEQYYLRARYYDPGVGRFTQMDTWQGRPCTPITLNKYLYAEADPIGKVDPSGNASLVKFAAVSTIVGIGATYAVNKANNTLYASKPNANDCTGGERKAQIRNVGVYAAMRAWIISGDALSRAQTISLPGRGHNDAKDAFRHCYWSCKMAKVIGKSDAKMVGDTHETCGLNPPAEKAMDLFNNEKGISLSFSTNCEQACVGAAKSKILQLQP